MSLLEDVAPQTALEAGRPGESGARRESEVHAVELSGLSKTYSGSRDAALKGVSLAVPAGSIFGLLGPNGAGKSTLINILGGLVRRSGGMAKVLGMDVQTRAARHAIGIVPQELTLDPYFTARAALDLQAGLYGIPGRARRTEELLATLGLADWADRPARSLSGGMRRRLMVAKALVHGPPVLVLDEPTAGVDVELRQQLWDHVRSLNRTSTTVLLTTHYLHEAEALCDRIAVLVDGRIVACDVTEALLRRLKDKVVEVRVDGPLVGIPPQLSSLNATISAPNTISVRHGSEPGGVQHIFAALHASGLRILDVKTGQPTLEAVFMDMVQRETPARRMSR